MDEIIKIEQLDFANICKIEVKDVPYDVSLIKLCEMNSCGNYGKSYTCPPNVGKPEVLIEKLKTYSEIYILQRIYPLEDSLDYEGMVEASNDFKMRVLKANEVFCTEKIEHLTLSAGGCKLCDRCGYIDNIPCRHPEIAFASLESCSINVSQLAKVCNINYINGRNTVTYFAGIAIK